MVEQLSLFGPEPDPPSRRGAPPGPADVPEELGQIAQRVPRHVHLGTSSWSFPGWEGLVWDRQTTASRLARDGLAAYAAHPMFRSVGVDRGYYAAIPRETFAGWAADVPDDFRFLVKAAQECTAPRLLVRGAAGRRTEDNPHFLDPQWTADQVVAPLAEGLGEKAGPLVFQFSPLDLRALGEARGFVDRLQRFLDALPGVAELPGSMSYAVELRNAAVLGEPYAEALRSVGAAHCFNLHPAMPSIERQLEHLAPPDGAPWVVRWMLHRGLQYKQAKDLYEPFDRIVDEDPEARRSIAELVSEKSSVRNPAFVIVNNKAEGSSPLSVFGLARALVGR